ncbi:hypothetical protein HOD19_02615 [bacterium]|jgi:hypothetical protein|nr:hypothetical protein [bacterium]MBT4649075.1 hypothetical protein [bacterium]
MYYISYRDQMLVIEKLYNSTDSVTSTKKFNEKYANKLGKMGVGQMAISDFARKMRQTHFSEVYIERYIKDVTKQDIDLDTF